MKGLLDNDLAVRTSLVIFRNPRASKANEHVIDGGDIAQHGTLLSIEQLISKIRHNLPLP